MCGVSGGRFQHQQPGIVLSHDKNKAAGEELNTLPTPEDLKSCPSTSPSHSGRAARHVERARLAKVESLVMDKITPLDHQRRIRPS